MKQYTIETYEADDDKCCANWMAFFIQEDSERGYGDTEREAIIDLLEQFL